MTSIPKSITITDRQLWIDGVPFPWHIAAEGPLVQYDVEADFPPAALLHLPIIFFTDETILSDLRTAPQEPPPPPAAPSQRMVDAIKALSAAVAEVQAARDELPEPEPTLVTDPAKVELPPLEPPPHRPW